MLRKYDIAPMKLVGYEGSCCFLTYLFVLIPIFSFMPCSFGANACVISDSGDSYFERPGIYFRELIDNTPVLITTIAAIFSILAFNICAISITDRINALARSVCDVMRTVLIWLAAYVVTVTAGENDENYRWESTDGRVIGLQMVGFVVLVLGNLIYNQIIPLKFVNNS